MVLPSYRQCWSKLKNSSSAPETIARLAGQVAASFLDGFLQDGSYSGDHIALLCEMSTAEADPRLTQPAARALFGIIIERLCDEFEGLPAEFYNRVMAQVISFCRRLPAGQSLDRGLIEAGIYRQEDIVERMARIGTCENRLRPDRPPRKIFVLSRATIGADIAVTSVILQRMKGTFPASELVLVGNEKCKEIFGGFEALEFAPVNYTRHGGVFERLDSWHQTRRIISGSRNAENSRNVVVIDPDSRLSQLGLLPLVPDERYFYFNSRSADAGNQRLSMGALTNDWLDLVSGQAAFCYPGLWPAGKDRRAAAEFCRQLQKTGARRLIAVNFGVGGNLRKKVGQPFELRLLNRLLEEPDTIVLLDKGFGEEESSNTGWLMERMQKQGHQVHASDIDTPPRVRPGCGLIGLHLNIGQLAALIDNCDEYIGYDSAGQHMAAALSVPSVTVFAGSNSMRFIQRWAALGPGSRHVVHVDTLTDPGAIDFDDVIGRVMTARGRA
jgi:hypothetical protein